MKRCLVTGAAGFIGCHVSASLVSEGIEVTGIDNFDSFYPRSMKEANLASLLDDSKFHFIEADITDVSSFEQLLGSRFDAIIHLAAKCGVRPSITDPLAYQHVNTTGTQVLLEFARRAGIEQFVFASSSSVYGINPRIPWSENDHDLQPISPYASTKAGGELLGHAYSHLHGIRFLALRLFTVYGPRQRPDLAIRKCAALILKREWIPVFGDGGSSRDYTYVDDVVEAIRAAIDYRQSRFEVINVGNRRSISILEMIGALESALQLEARIEHLPAQPGDVPHTCADIRKARELLGYAPKTTFHDGIEHFAEWMRSSNESA
ncbi:MAG: GDP-mannose 4,6-dehydratase [Acidobacteriaceae bacterium]|nr:GDP-mannose 4,6-dehydratase [Acidobacteriaceae bacterium]